MARGLKGVFNFRRTEKERKPRQYFIEPNQSPPPNPLQDIEKAQLLLQETEALFKTFAPKWNTAANYAYEQQLKEIHQFSDAIETTANNALKEAFKKICLSNLEFMREALLAYQESVKQQWLFRFRRGRKKLNTLEGFLESLRTFEDAVNQSRNFNDLIGMTEQLSAFINDLIKKAETLKLNTGNFHSLIDELIIQRHALLVFKEHSPENIRPLLLNLFEIPRGAAEETSEKAKKSFDNYDHYRYLKESQELLNKTQKPKDQESPSTWLSMARFSLEVFIQKITRLKNKLSENLTGMKKIFPPKLLKQKEEITEQTKRTFESYLQVAKDNYQQRLIKIITDYENQIRKQWFWRLRLGFQKLALFKAYLSGNISFTDLKTQKSLNKGKSTSVIEKISTVLKKEKELYRTREKFESVRTQSPSVFIQEMDYTLEQFKLPLGWLNDVSSKAQEAQAQIQLLSPTPPQESKTEEILEVGEEKAPAEETTQVLLNSTLMKNPWPLFNIDDSAEETATAAAS